MSIGDVVTLDLGGGDETYVGSFEQAFAGVDTVTPGSPLGRAIAGAEVGSMVTFSPRRWVNVDVLIRAAGEPLPVTA